MAGVCSPVARSARAGVIALAVAAGCAACDSRAYAIQVVSIADTVEKVMGGVVNIRTRDAQSGASAFDGAGGADVTRMDRFLELFLAPGQLPGTRQARSLGSGFFVQQKEYVVTNYHVVKDAESIDVVTAGSRFGQRAKLLGFNKKVDIAVLRVDPVEGAHALRFANSESARIGEAVFTIGNPFGYGHTVTSGILSARGRTIGAGPFDDFLQTDAAVNPGNSGGPLFNARGEVIGINTALLADARGISFAIPSEIAKPVIERIIQGKKSTRVWLGVVASDLADDSAEPTPQSYGVLVRNLAKGSPAEKSGVLPGDVILGVNGVAVRDAAGLDKVIRARKDGETITLRLHRKGSPLKVDVQARVMPELEGTDELFQ